MNSYYLTKLIATELLGLNNFAESDVISRFDDIDVDKLSLLVENIEGISVDEYHEFMNLLFLKYEHLFERLVSIGIYIDKNMYVPSKIKSLCITAPYLFTTKEKLNLETLQLIPYNGNMRETDLKDDIEQNINFETIKEFNLNGASKYLLDVEKMINLEKLDLYNIHNRIDITITHLDKLTSFAGYTGQCDLPANIMYIYYHVHTVKKIPPGVKKLDLNFNSDIDEMTEFSCDSVDELSIRSNVSLEYIYCYFPNVLKLFITCTDEEFTNRTVKNCQNIQQLQINNIDFFDFDIISDLSNLSTLILHGYRDYCRICSDSVTNINFRGYAKKIELETLKLLILHVTTYDAEDMDNIIVLSSQKEHLDEISIRGEVLNINISELKTRSLIIYSISDLILPSYYECLEIHTRLSASWLTYDVKTLIVNIFEYGHVIMKTDTENIYAPHLTKLIIKHHFDRTDFDHTKYLTLSDHCEIEYQVMT